MHVYETICGVFMHASVCVRENALVCMSVSVCSGQAEGLVPRAREQQDRGRWHSYHSQTLGGKEARSFPAVGNTTLLSALGKG